MLSSTMQGAKSTPSLNTDVSPSSTPPQINVVESTDNNTQIVPTNNNVSATTNSVQAKWKNSLDSLDTVSTVSSSSPRYNESFSSDRQNNNNSGNSFSHSSNNQMNAEPKPVPPEILNVPKRTTSMNSGTSSNSSNSTGGASGNGSGGGGAHSHSHSDSGLSSLSCGAGRTATMSPVSTMSTVSSVSSAAGSSSGSSRASLRSASIVSTHSPPESLKEVHDDEEEEEEEEKISSDSGNGTLKKGSTTRIPTNKFQEEIDCEELSKELFDAGKDEKMHSLFGKRFRELRLECSGKDIDELSLIRSPFLPIVPSPQQKTLADYVEGILELDLEDGRGQPQRKVIRRNLSPNLLRRKIEELKDGKR